MKKAPGKEDSNTVSSRLISFIAGVVLGLVAWLILFVLIVFLGAALS